MAFKFQEWQEPNGKWYAAAINETIKTGRGKWWFPARKLGLPLTKYVDLIKSYGATEIKYFPSSDLLLFSFDKQEKAHKFVLYINRMARNNNW